jgi:hypothetical protein
MIDFKCWYQSRAMWGALIAIASGVANLMGHQIGPQEQQALIEVLSGLTAMAGGLLALWGRFHATSKIGAPPKEEQ